MLYTLLLLCVVPIETQTRHVYVDIVEHNYVYNEKGTLILDQFVFLEADGESVRGWCRVKTGDFENPLLITINDKLYVIRYGVFRVSHTQYDVERENREKLPQEMRRHVFETAE